MKKKVKQKDRAVNAAGLAKSCLLLTTLGLGACHPLASAVVNVEDINWAVLRSTDGGGSLAGETTLAGAMLPRTVSGSVKGEVGISSYCIEPLARTIAEYHIESSGEGKIKVTRERYPITGDFYWEYIQQHDLMDTAKGFYGPLSVAIPPAQEYPFILRQQIAEPIHDEIACFVPVSSDVDWQGFYQFAKKVEQNRWGNSFTRSADDLNFSGELIFSYKYVPKPPHKALDAIFVGMPGEGMSEVLPAWIADRINNGPRFKALEWLRVCNENYPSNPNAITECFQRKSTRYTELITQDTPENI